MVKKWVHQVGSEKEGPEPMKRAQFDIDSKFKNTESGDDLVATWSSHFLGWCHVLSPDLFPAKSHCFTYPVLVWITPVHPPSYPTGCPNHS